MTTKEPNNSPDFRRECEAREIMKWELQKRQAHYAAIREKRGELAAKELINEVKKQYRLSQQQAMEI